MGDDEQLAQNTGDGCVSITRVSHNGMTVGEVVEFLKTQDQSLPLKIFAAGDIWSPEQIIFISHEDYGDDTPECVEIGCGWNPDIGVNV